MLKKAIFSAVVIAFATLLVSPDPQIPTVHPLRVIIIDDGGAILTIKTTVRPKPHGHHIDGGGDPF
jgi:hypothetical protein